jgi:bla regulator protein BlaR1
MEFKLIDFLPENWLHAFGITLFHSLWLGLVLSLLVAIIVFFTRKSTAALRYNLLTACMFLFVAVITFVFYKELGVSSKNISISVIQNQIIQGEEQVHVSSISNAQAYLSVGLNKILKTWNDYTAQIVLVWFLIICARSIQLLVGLNGIYHLRNSQVYASGKKWDAKLAELSNRLGIHQSVEMLQSGIAKVPMVVGHFKPLILIPLGLINSLSIAEVEAIICHELAHIKRRDYLVNLIQSFVEIVFFFNPAVLWLSKLIRTERENCCDDLAIASVDDKRNYVKALISCQEFQLNAPELAMAINGRKNHLLQRVSRMLFNTKSTLNKMEKTILTIALVSVLICSAAFKSAENKSFSAKKTGPIAILANDPSPQDTSKKKAIDAEKALVDRKEAEIKRKMDEQAKANLEASSKKKAIEIQKNAIDRQQAEIEKTIAKQRMIQAEATKSMNEDSKIRTIKAQNDEIIRRQKGEINKQRIEQVKLSKRALEADAKYLEAQKAYAIAEKQYAKDREAYAREQLNYNKNAAQYDSENKNVNIQIPITAITPIPYNAQAPITPPSPPSYATVSPKSSLKTSTKTGSERGVKSITVINGDGHDYTDEINGELLKDGIISSTNKLSYKLDKNSLTINGVKQPESVHKKYKEKYLKRDDRSLMYNFEVNSSH